MENENNVYIVILRYIDTLNLEGLEAVDSFAILYDNISEFDRKQLHIYIQAKIDHILNLLEDENA